MPREIIVKVKLPLASGKDATLTREGDEVRIDMPVGFKVPKVKLDDLSNAVAELASVPSEGNP